MQNYGEKKMDLRQILLQSLFVYFLWIVEKFLWIDSFQLVQHSNYPISQVPKPILSAFFQGAF